MTTNQTPLRRLAAGAGALALALMGAVGFAGTAQAALPPGNPPPAQAPDGATGQLTVHKRVGTQNPTGNNGTNLGDGAPGTPLADVQFTVQRIGVWTGGSCVAIDLRTKEGWDAAAAGNGANPPAPVSPAAEGAFCAYGTPEVRTTTGATGTAVFPDLALGLFYVTETDWPANVIERAAPFYVTIPFASVSGAATTWLYDVHAYPKNSTAALPTKTISERPSALTIGSTVTWTIAQTIPTLAGVGASFTEASVSDVLDPRLSYASAVVAITDPTGAQLVAADYIFDPDGLTWTFNTDGKAKLTANQGKTLTVTLTTTVTSVGSGTITNNGATVSFNDVPQSPQVAPNSYWGNLVVNKYDNTDNDKKLAGAEFAVFEKAADAACPTSAPGGPSVATGVTDATGVVQWASVTPASPLGLWIANSDTEMDNPTKDYCLYETKPPAGYTAITTPWTVTITIATGALATQNIANTPVPGPILPLTGADGTMLFTLAGVALVAVAGGGFLVRRARASR